MQLESPTDPAELGPYLRRLATRPPHPASRAVLHEALRAKREDVQVVAARAIARWEDAETTAALKACLAGLVRKESGGGGVSAIAQILSERLDATDLDWVLDLYFVQATWRHRERGLHSLFWKLPAGEAEAAIRRRPYLDRDERLALREIEWARSHPGEVLRCFAYVRSQIMNGKPRSHAPRKRPDASHGADR